MHINLNRTLSLPSARALVPWVSCSIKLAILATSMDMLSLSVEYRGRLFVIAKFDW